MEALIGNAGCHLPQRLPVTIQSLRNIECHISPHDKHFADVNVLGADFLVKNGLTLKANDTSDICTLMVDESIIPFIELDFACNHPKLHIS